MPMSLHAAIIPTYQQMLGALGGLVDKAESWCNDQACAPSALIEARLSEDMLPFGYQLQCCWAHSAHALAGCAAGHFEPYRAPWPDSFTGLRALLATTQAELAAVDEAQLEAIAGKDLVFTIGEAFRKEFTVQDFLLSFSQPNFFFHATTAYAIMRKEGVPLGKRDYLGAFRAKG